MRIGRSTLSDLKDPNKFVAIFAEFAEHVLGKARLFPKLSKPRLIEACGAWKNDLDRVGSNEPNLEGGLDHLKHAGHLSFWLRRMSPLVEAIDLTKDFADAEGYPLSDSESAFRRILLPYANEYLAFDFGYQIARYYELAKEGGSSRASNMALSVDYYKTMCHFLKYKSVSPHALHLIYKSLFME